MRFGLHFSPGPFSISIPIYSSRRRRYRRSSAGEGGLLLKGLFWLFVGPVLLGAALLAWPWWVAVKVVAPKRGWSSAMAHGVGFGWTVAWLLVMSVLGALG